MPLYTYCCEKCGPIDLCVSLDAIEKPLTCPICEYNAATEGLEKRPKFDDWIDEGWEKHPKDKDHVFLAKLIDAPARIRIN